MWFLEKLMDRNRKPTPAGPGTWSWDVARREHILKEAVSPLRQREHIESEDEELRRGDW